MRLSKMLKKSKKLLKPLVMLGAIGLAFTVFQNETYAAQADMLKKSGIVAKDLTGDSDSFFTSAKNVVYLIMGFGGLWCVGWIAIAGMLLGGSGSNPQKRSAGIGAVATAAVGAFIIYKAYDIAGWAINLGSQN